MELKAVRRNLLQNGDIERGAVRTSTVEELAATEAPYRGDRVPDSHAYSDRVTPARHTCTCQLQVRLCANVELEQFRRTDVAQPQRPGSTDARDIRPKKSDAWLC